MKRLVLLAFVVMFTGAWGGFSDIEETRYYQYNWGVNVDTNQRGNERMVIKDETINYSDDLAYAVAQWDKGDCHWGDYDPNTCPGVNVRFKEPNDGIPVTMRVVEINEPNGCCWAWVVDGKMVLNHGALQYETEAFVRETIMHEMGHALGFKHFPAPAYTCKTLMVGCYENMQGPTNIDKALYYHRWVKRDWNENGVIVNPEKNPIRTSDE